MPVCLNCKHPNPDGARFCAQCGFSTQPAEMAVSPVGTVLRDGRYRLKSLLGKGGMGQVWRAHDDQLDIEVALKILNPDLLGHPTARKRTIDEAKLLARIRARSKGANVVGIYDYFEHEGTVVLALELVEGGDLHDRLESGPVPWPEAITLMGGILQGLQALHEVGLVHRDLKPGNVLLDGERPLITDLGVAHDDDGDHLTKLGVLLGTPAYMSPEQVRGEPVELRSDLYAAGIILFELLVGAPPFEGLSDFDVQKAQTEGRVPLERLPADVPEGVRGVIERAMEKKPAHRWPSASAMADALRLAVGWGTGDFAAQTRPPTEPQVRTPTPSAPTLDRPSAPSGKATGGGALPWAIAGAALVGLIVVMVNPSDGDRSEAEDQGQQAQVRPKKAPGSKKKGSKAEAETWQPGRSAPDAPRSKENVAKPKPRKRATAQPGMVAVSERTFWMGGRDWKNAIPLVEIKLSSFQIDRHIRGNGLNWYEAQADCERRGLSLPTEAQWEAAVMAGIIDMSGPEWVKDWFHKSAYGNWTAGTDPEGPPEHACQRFPGSWKKFKRMGEHACCKVMRGDNAASIKEKGDRRTRRGYWGPDQGHKSRQYRCAGPL